MPRDFRAYLWDVLDAVGNIETFVRGASLDAYTRDVLMRSAVERQFEIIGEALNQLSKVAPQIAEQIPELRRVVAFRNLLIHGYAAVDDALVWRTIQERLPELRDAVQQQMDHLGEH
jgi:uncharacterized protein with HEPN domain